MCRLFLFHASIVTNSFRGLYFFVLTVVSRRQNMSVILVLVLRTEDLSEKTCKRLFRSNLRLFSAVVIQEACGKSQTIFAAQLLNATKGSVANVAAPDRKSTRLNSSHRCISYAVFCLK